MYVVEAAVAALSVASSLGANMDIMAMIRTTVNIIKRIV